MKRSMSLRLQLTLAVGLLTSAMALLFGLLVYPLLQAQLLGAVDARLRAQAARLASTLADARQPTAPLPAFDALEIYAELIGPNGAIRARSPALPASGLAVDVRLRRSGSAAQLVVADSGPGIAVEHPRISGTATTG